MTNAYDIFTNFIADFFNWIKCFKIKIKTIPVLLEKVCDFQYVVHANTIKWETYSYANSQSTIADHDTGTNEWVSSEWRSIY